MKAKILCIGACLVLFLSFFTLFNTRAKAANAIEEATFCMPGTIRPCPDVGICKGRVKTCENGKWSEECTGGVGPAPQEICDNGLDDNCNGIADECISLSGSIGIFLIISGTILLAFSIALLRFIK
ncbi:MAG: hypothetical protein NTY20_00370 [Candidatus Aenigmarchaeota archaeon]|nr:hypothetical protein [Candidatus Aenigmarchaeota archaeon]